MLGGLITERDSNDKTGLPFLVRIPILKHLFGSTTKNKSRKELMIFVQPHIMADGATHVQEQAEWGKQNIGFDSTLRFAEPPDEPPLAAQEKSNGRSQPEDGTPLLPLPAWSAKEVRPTVTVRSRGSEKASKPSVTIPKAELVE
jgi:hypothetical protein